MKDPQPEDLDQDPALRELRYKEKLAHQTVRERISDIEVRLAREAGKFPAEFHQRFDDVKHRLEGAKSDFDHHVEDFRERFLFTPVTEDEMRARLVMLDMEYGSRTRLAEEGLKLLSESLESHLETSRGWVHRFCEEAQGAARTEVHPVRAKIAQALRGRSRYLRAKEVELKERLRSLERAEKRVLDLEREKRELLSKEDWKGVRKIDKRLIEGKAARKGRAARLEREAAGLRERLKEAEGRTHDLEESNFRLREASEALRKEEEELHGRLTAHREESARAEELRERTEGGLRSAHSELETLKSRLELETARREEYAHGAQELVDRLNEENDSKDKELGQLRGRLRKMEGAAQAAPSEEVSESLREDLEQNEVELSRLRAELERVRASSAVDPVDEDLRKIWKVELGRKDKEIAELRKELSAKDKRRGRPAPGVGPAIEVEAMRQKLSAAESELTSARAEIQKRAQTAEQLAGAASAEPCAGGEPERRLVLSESELAGARAEVQRLSRELKSSQDKTRSMLKRLMEADKGRDDVINEAQERWMIEKEELEDRLAQRARELNQIKLESEAGERAWIETVARQDAERVQELFKLRSKIQQLKRALEQRRPPPPEKKG